MKMVENASPPLVVHLWALRLGWAGERRRRGPPACGSDDPNWSFAWLAASLLSLHHLWGDEGKSIPFFFSPATRLERERKKSEEVRRERREGEVKSWEGEREREGKSPVALCLSLCGSSMSRV